MVQEIFQHALVVRASDGAHQLRRYPFPEVVGPVDFGLLMQQEGCGLCIGSGILAGSIIPGSNRLIFSGHSSLWGGFYVSTMGGASLIWDGIGISFLAIQGRAEKTSALVIHGNRDERSPQVRLVPVDLDAVWTDGERPGFYALQHHAFHDLWEASGTPRVLAVGPAAGATQMGAIGSSRTVRGRITAVDCWAGRGGFGSKLLQEHNLCAIVYGGDFEDEDLTDRAEADGYFQKRFSKKMLLEDLEATTKYRYDPRWKSGGTFGVNYSKLSDWMLSFNYRSVDWSRDRRIDLWKRLVRDHYLDQFNLETIAAKQFSHCGEPCPAVCKKLNDHYKKDYEPYQTMGPLAGIFDQRAAERVNHHADALGFDAIQIGGQLAWLMECLKDGIVDAGELGLPDVRPVFEPNGFEAVADSGVNADLALAMLDKCVEPGHLLTRGMRAAARKLGPAAVARAVYLANGPEGWMVPNQYWVPGMLAPMAVMGKYYVNYKADFLPPRELGRSCAERMIAELTTDNAGVCRFHRGWSEQLWAEIVNGHFETQVDYPAHHARLAKALHLQGQPVYWESRRIEKMLHAYLRRIRETEPEHPELGEWLERFEADAPAAARAYWQELRAGIDQRMGEIPG